ncbi:MAG: flagellar motor protein MotB [Defluviitaleaceae bacterium]|nr:flagellar motor protein MotB [Defluviitaleaceae bacterium]
MTTYGDMVTLLLCFFIMLYSISNIDADKFKLLAESLIGKEINIIDSAIFDKITSDNDSMSNGYADDGIQNGTDENRFDGNQNTTYEHNNISEMVAEFESYLSGNDITAGIVVEELGEYMRLRLPDGILFGAGSADLIPGAYNVLEILIVEMLKYPENEIRVEGHTCDLPINTERFPNNLYLSSARADTVVLYFIEKGFSPKRFTSEGKGEWWPIASNETPEGRALNRRVEIKIFARQTKVN